MVRMRTYTITKTVRRRIGPNQVLTLRPEGLTVHQRRRHWNEAQLLERKTVFVPWEDLWPMLLEYDRQQQEKEGNLLAIASEQYDRRMGRFFRRLRAKGMSWHDVAQACVYKKITRRLGPLPSEKDPDWTFLECFECWDREVKRLAKEELNRQPTA